MLSETQKLTALTGAIQASKHKRVGIRPAGQSGAKPIPLSIAPPLTGNNIDTAMESASLQWPDCNQWDIVGADGWDMDGNWLNPYAYATFESEPTVTGEGDSGFTEGV